MMHGQPVTLNLALGERELWCHCHLPDLLPMLHLWGAGVSLEHLSQDRTGLLRVR